MVPCGGSVCVYAKNMGIMGRDDEVIAGLKQS